ENQRRFSRSRDARKDRQSPLRDLDADVLQVVDPCAVDTDHVVTISGMEVFSLHAGRILRFVIRRVGRSAPSSRTEARTGTDRSRGAGIAEPVASCTPTR